MILHARRDASRVIGVSIGKQDVTHKARSVFSVLGYGVVHLYKLDMQGHKYLDRAKVAMEWRWGRITVIWRPHEKAAS